MWLQDWGTDPETGLFYEVQEYIPGGSLNDDTIWDPAGLVGALTDAVGVFHTVVGAHRDIKPGNVLVRSWDGPVLVLADVGLARLVGATSKRFSRRDGTAAYQSPEASQGQVSRAGDWWAIGILIAHAALGRHPLALPDGRFPSDQVILAHLAQRDIDLSGITDPRLRLLCQGLLTRDADRRWTIDQVRAWQHGHSPTTGYGTATTPTSGHTGLIRSVHFNGAEHTNPTSLAAAFATDPVNTGTRLFQEKDPTLLIDLRLMLRAAGLPDAETVLTEYKSGPWEQTFLRLLVEMDPHLTPTLAGQDMTPAGVGAAVQEVLNTGYASADQWNALTWITEHNVWQLWRTLAGMEGSTQTAERLTRLGEMDPLLIQAGLWKEQNGWQRLVVNSDGNVSWRNPDTVLGLEGRELLDKGSVEQYWNAQAWRATAWKLLLAAAPLETHVALAANIHDNTPQLPHQTWWTTLTNGDPTQLALAAILTGLAHTAEYAYTPTLTALTRDRRAEHLRTAANEVAERKQALERAELEYEQQSNRARELKRKNTWLKAAVFSLILSGLLASLPANIYSNSFDSMGCGPECYAIGTSWVTFPALAIGKLPGTYDATGLFMGWFFVLFLFSTVALRSLMMMKRVDLSATANDQRASFLNDVNIAQARLEKLMKDS